MAYVIAVAGAGGKTSYIAYQAQSYAASGKKVAVTTTTHMYPMEEREGISFFGRADKDGKVAYPGKEVYDRLCAEYDVVLAEADGSRHFPIKVPNETEPVIPENTDEIVIIMVIRVVNPVARLRA